MTSGIELQSLLQFTSNNEVNKHYEAKQLFDSTHALSKTKDNQWRHMMLCLKVLIMKQIITALVNHYLIF